MRDVNNMLVTIVVLGTVTTAVIMYMMRRMFGRVNADPLGWMSEQWLAEHRASDLT